MLAQRTLLKGYYPKKNIGNYCERVIMMFFQLTGSSSEKKNLKTHANIYYECFRKLDNFFFL